MKAALSRKSSISLVNEDTMMFRFVTLVTLFASGLFLVAPTGGRAQDELLFAVGDEMEFSPDLASEATLESAAEDGGIWDAVAVPDTVGVGLPGLTPTVNALVRDAAMDNQIVGMTVAATKDGRLVYSGAFGFANWDKRTPLQNFHRMRIGSSSKVPVTMAMLHLADARPDVSLDRKVYGSPGILSDQEFTDAFQQGTRRLYPLVALAIGQNNRVIAWYSDGTFTIGSSDDLDRHKAPEPFTLPPVQQIHDIVGIARGGPNNRVFTWYLDGSYSIGTPNDLDAHEYQRARGNDAKYKSRRRDTILAVSADTRVNVFYAYYNDGFVTSGTSPSDLTDRWQKTFSVPSEERRRYDIVGVARSDNDVTVAWYSDDRASKGNAVNLASIAGLFDYERRFIQGSRRKWLDAYRAIEIRHLVSHTSGFTHSGNWERAAIAYGIQADAQNNPLPYRFSNMYALSTRPLLFEPGTGTSYSNHGLGLVGFLIQELTGQTWFEYLHEHILQPAGAGRIQAGGIALSPFDDSNGHRVDRGRVVTQGFARSVHPGSAAGSLRATAVDLARLLVATDGLANHPDVLPASTLALMESRPFPAVASGRAHGWQVNCDQNCSSRRLWHNGLVSGGSSFIAKYQGYEIAGETVDGVTVAIATNTETTSGLSGLANRVALEVSRTPNQEDLDLFNPVVP